MRNELGLALLMVVLAAGCVGQTDGVMQSMLTLDIISGGAEDMAISAKVPEFARTEKDFNWQLIAEPAITVRDFGIGVYDRCSFSNVGQESFSLPAIPANNTQIFTLTYRTPKVEFEKTCKVYFSANYTSNATLSTTVAALQDAEYMQRKQAGSLGDIPTSTWKSRNPLELSISWGPEGMPLLDSSSNYMYIDYRNAGNGAIPNLKPGQVMIQVPANMGDGISCDDYSWNAGSRTLTLSRQLDFLQKQAKRSTCTFTAKASQPVDSATVVISAAYRYIIEGSVGIPLLAR